MLRNMQCEYGISTPQSRISNRSICGQVNESNFNFAEFNYVIRSSSQILSPPLALNQTTPVLCLTSARKKHALRRCRLFHQHLFIMFHRQVQQAQLYHVLRTIRHAPKYLRILYFSRQESQVISRYPGWRSLQNQLSTSSNASRSVGFYPFSKRSWLHHGHRPWNQTKK